MNHTRWIASIAGVLTIVVSVLTWTRHTDATTGSPVLSFPPQPMSVSPSPVSSMTDPAQALADLPATDAGQAREDAEVLLSEREAKLRLAEVTAQYEQDIQYPVTSMPIPDATALEKYLPNRGFSHDMALDPNDAKSPRLALLTDRHRYFAGEDIIATVRVSGTAPGAQVEVKGRLIRAGQTVAETPAESLGDGESFGLAFNGDANALPTGELRLVASLTLDGVPYELGTPIERIGVVAEISGVGASAVVSEYLVIPVAVSTSQPGYHEVSGNLYSVATGEPLVHLSGQEEIASSQGQIVLKAHVRALKFRNDAGPYVLRDLQLMRMPAPPDFTALYGRTSQPAYPVTGYPFETYVDAPYVDEEAQDRLAFLRSLGSSR